MPEEEFAFAPEPPEARPEDLAVEEVGDRVYRLPLPIPFEVGPVNCYLLRREEPVLIDTGPRTDDSYAALIAHLAALGLRASDLSHIIISHAHVDHHGNLGRLAAEAPEAAIYVHEDDARPVFEHDENMVAKAGSIRDLVRFWGYPCSTFDAVLKGYLYFRRFADSLDRARLVPIRGERADLALGPTRLEAHHCPGHTEGLICPVLAEDPGAIFASDHLLERITPNPTVYLPPYRGRRTGLADYLSSLRRVRDLPVARVLPGHGRAFGGLAGRVDEILGHHEIRKRAIRGLLAAGGAATILELVLKLWPGLAPSEFYLASREVHGHLDLLIEEGSAAQAALGADGVGRFVAR